MSPRFRLLVIEDDPVMGSIIASVLRAHDLILATTGEEGLEQFAAAPFDLVLCDLTLPGMSGLEVIRKIRELKPAARVMVVSAYGTPQNLLASLRHNVVDFVVKPFSPEDLVCAVENVLICEEAIETISANPQWIELMIPASFQVAASLRTFFANLQSDLDEETRHAVAAAFEELMNNAIEHGARGDHRKRIRISYVRLERAVIYRIDDPGPGFDLAALPHAAISYPGDPMRHVGVRTEKGLRPGGFGMLWVQSLADEVVYDERRNKVMFVKYLPQASGP